MGIKTKTKKKQNLKWVYSWESFYLVEIDKKPSTKTTTKKLIRTEIKNNEPNGFTLVWMKSMWEWSACGAKTTYACGKLWLRFNQSSALIDSYTLKWPMLHWLVGILVHFYWKHGTCQSGISVCLGFFLSLKYLMEYCKTHRRSGVR